MNVKIFTKKVMNYIKRKIVILQMEWIDFDADTKEDINAWEGVFNKKIETKKEPYIIKKRNVALLTLVDSFEEYKKGKDKQAFRTNYNKAVKKGYLFKKFEGFNFFDDLMEINTSSELRAGRKMSEIYTDPKLVKEFLKTSPDLYGAFTSQGKLVGYFHVLSAGKLMTINKILGHHAYLADGIMYFMLGELLKVTFQMQEEFTHIMYGTYLYGESGAGVFYYKERCGFRGWNVRHRINVVRESIDGTI